MHRFGQISVDRTVVPDLIKFVYNWMKVYREYICIHIWNSCILNIPKSTNFQAGLVDQYIRLLEYLQTNEQSLDIEILRFLVEISKFYNAIELNGI